LFFSFENLPFYAYDSPQTERVAFSWRKGGAIQVDVMDTNASRRFHLVEGASAAGDPIWLPDGTTVVVAWQTISGSSQTGGITWWANAPGTATLAAPQTFPARLQNVDDLKVLADGQTVVYVAQRNNRYAVETLTLKTRANLTRADGFASVHAIHQDSGTHEITFWWRTPDGGSGVDRYSSTGKRLFRYKAEGVVNEGGLVFPSPDGHHALLLVTNRGQVRLQIAFEDRWARITRDEPGLGQAQESLWQDRILWAPDSSKVAVRYPARADLDIINADGSLLPRSRSYHIFDPVWTHCNESLVRRAP
jgi:Tol biopolymer transport system component